MRGQSEMRRRIGEGCRGVRSKWRLERHHRVLLRPMLLLLRPVLLLLWPVLQWQWRRRWWAHVGVLWVNYHLILLGVSVVGMRDAPRKRR
jgi:hypothetical protein